MPRHPFRGPLLLAGALLALSACGGDDGDDSAETTAATSSASESPETSSTPATTDASPTDEPSTEPGGQVPAGYPPRPAPDECVVVPEAPDGVYTVYEAGSAVVTRDGDRLVLGPVTPADGWTHRVDDQDDDEIEIDFRAGGTDVLDLEVEIDDGRVEVQICADDD